MITAGFDIRLCIGLRLKKTMPNAPGWIIGFLLFLFAIAVNGRAGNPQSDILLLKNDASGISLRYRTPTVAWMELETPARTYRTPNLRGAGTFTQEGAPQLPVRIIWLAVPPGVTANIASVTPYGISSADCVPVPVPRLDAAGAPSFDEDPEFYAATIPFPAVWAELQGPESYRDLEVIRLLVYPCRFPSENGGTLMLDSVDVQVQFQGGSAAVSGYSRPLEDEFYSGLIANWEGPAKTWKQPRLRQVEISDPWPSGDLYKMEIDESGIYKLTYNDLVNAGINLDGLDPRTIRIFNNGGEALPKDLIVPRPDGPIENAILAHGEEDGVFNQGDEIWFYGKSVHEWETVWYSPEQRYRFQHYQNHYTDHNIYWLNINPSGPQGKRMGALGVGGEPDFTPSTTKAYYFEEKDIYAIYSDLALPQYMPNLYGDLFSGVSATRTFSFYLENVVDSAPALLTIVLNCPEQGTHEFKVSINNHLIVYTAPDSYAIEVTTEVDPGILYSNGSNSLRIEHLSAGSAYLDYFELEYTRSLTTSLNRIDFISPDATGLTQYEIEGITDPWIFDVTDFDDVKAVQASTFKDYSEALSPRRYIALNSSKLFSPLSIEKDRRDGDEYVNLRMTLGADLLVIAGDAFYDAMAAYEEYRETEAPTPMEVLRVRVSDIYDEYGWGLPDPVAIRDFLKTTLPIYNWAVSPIYLLIVGDGDFDYKNKLSTSGGNWVIPFEEQSRCTDDWYSYFEPTDNSGAYPQLATGRWPVQSIAEVEEMIERVRIYESGQDLGPWRDRVLLVADDEYGRQGGYSAMEATHTTNSELLANNYFPGILNVQKLYLTEYPVSSDPAGGGRRKPEAGQDLVAEINDGYLLVNYIGHGNPTVWAHEHVFLQSRDLPLLYNGTKLPLFVAATCEWAYWDDPFTQSMPEIMLTLPGGGAIAVIAATRETSPGANQDLLENLYLELFAEPAGCRFGTALMRAKSRSFVHNPFGGGNVNQEKYNLLGDPFLRLAMPQLTVQINPSSADTLVALGEFTVSGEICTQSGGPLPSFSGTANLQVLDAPIPIYYGFNNNPPPSTPTYYLPGNLIFRGDVSVQDGRFQSTFIVPVDISYAGTTGRYSIYACSDEVDAAGMNDNVFIGESAVALTDTIPPDIKVYFDSPAYRSGDPVSTEAKLYVEVCDSNGINLTGNVGHGIIVTIDDLSPIDLTDSFSYFLDSYKSGRAEHQFLPGEITPGEHHAQAVAWDAANNPNTAEIDFVVIGTEELALTDVLNYPNPFRDYTRFTFFLSEPALVTIKIYTVAGRLVKVISGIQGIGTFNWDDPLLVWDGRDEQGDLVSNGVYIYKICAEGLSGGFAEEIGKLIAMR